MNLVAKEFCAAQIDERGVLIVSEFAGAGSELRSGAIIVNPNDFAEVAQALYDAAHMTADEKRSRMRLLRQIVKDHNVHRWIRSFLEAIPSLDQVRGGSGSDSWPAPSGATAASSFASPFGSAVRVDHKMPGVALLASGIPPGRRSRYSMKEAKLRLIGTAVGED